VTEHSQAVFLSYASQDAEAAARICAALRAAGIEVWFDQSELRGGDAWDAAIRRQIRSCALFVAIISKNTHERVEGYFRLEWKLAVDRSHLIVANKPFLVPVVIDDTGDDDEQVPDKFREVQWTRMADGRASPEFVARIVRLLSPDSAHVPALVRLHPPASHASWRSKLGWLAVAMLLAGSAYLLVQRPWGRQHELEPQPAAGTRPAAGAVSEQSIAVMPFADMSEGKDQEYFADGLAEELLDLLAKTPGLHVVARTSSFSFRGKSDDIPTIAAKLRVANVLEGSVRKSGNRLRVTTQLVRAMDGEHLWSETYDRQLEDVFKVQDDIAATVAAALKLRLVPGQESSPIRSSNPDAHLQYLLGQQYLARGSVEDERRAVGAFSQAIALDPHYAAAYARLAIAQAYLGDDLGDAARIAQGFKAADQAIALAPDQALGYAARGTLRYQFSWDWSGAQADYARALELAPNDPVVLRGYTTLIAKLGRLQEAIAIEQRIIDFDPLSAVEQANLAFYQICNGELAAARESLRRALSIDPASYISLTVLGTLELLEQRPAEALAVFQKLPGDEPGPLAIRLTGTAMAQHSLGRGSEAQLALNQAIDKAARAAAYQIAEVFAWSGGSDGAFQWLERAYRQRDSGMAMLKIDPMIGSLRNDPRYKTLLRKMNLPE